MWNSATNHLTVKNKKNGQMLYDTSDKIFYDTSANNNLIVQAI